MGGAAKALLMRNGKTFLSRIVELVSDPIVVVGPPYGDQVAAHARDLGARVVENPAPERGMASSVALGFAAVDADAAWLWPVDHPDVVAATLRTLIASLGHHAAARPVYQGRGGHPPLIARSLFGALAVCTNARDVLANADTVDVVVDDRGCVRDIDRPEDLR